MVAGRPTAQRPLTTAGGDLAGLYGPRSAAWRLNREAALLLGAGPHALLLQVGHPLVAEGVSQHSDFRTDPWARLAGTLRAYLRIVYGTTPAARAEIPRLNRLHAGSTGPVRDAAAATHGAAYRALDPALSLWVHATLIHSTLRVTDRWQGHTRPTPGPPSTPRRGRSAGCSACPTPCCRGRRRVRRLRRRDALFGRADPPLGAARELAASILRPPLAGVSGLIADALGGSAPLARRALDPSRAGG